MSKATQNDHFFQVFQATSRAVMITDGDGRIVSANQAFTELTGWSAEDAIGQSPRILSSGRQDADFYEGMWAALRAEGHWEGELWNRRKDGEVFPEHLTIDAIRADAAKGAEGAITHYVAVFSNVDEKQRRETQLVRMTFRDVVTGLPTRALCEDRIERAIALARRRAGNIAVMMIDLDGFKVVNDGFGSEAGDLVLKASGERIRACLRESDTVARWGEDEFAVVVPTVDGASGVREAGLRILSALRRPFVMAGDEIALGSSIGAALFPGDGESAEDILACAHRVMRAVKQTGKGGFALHGDGDTGSRSRRVAV